MHDVLVVGGSLAGAATAIHLARMGRSVVLLERATEYRRKACGEGLFPRGVSELARLGVLEAVREHGAPLTGLRFTAGTHSAVAQLGATGRTGLGVQRRHLDAALLARAAEDGVDVRRGVTARGLIIEGGRSSGVTTGSGEVRARAIVAADGLQSRLRREAGLDSGRRGTRYGVSGHLRLPAPPADLVDVYFEDGYELYLTPVGGDLVNAALLLRRPGMRRFAGDLAGGYRALLARHPALARGFEMEDEPAVAGPFAAGCSRAWRANVILAGDAAGFFDGISGEGMSVALASALACAEAVDDYLRDDSYRHFRDYEGRRRAMVRNSNLLARVSLTLGSRQVLARLAVRNLSRQPETFTRLTGVNSGELGLRNLRPRDLAALAFGL